MTQSELDPALIQILLRYRSGMEDPATLAEIKNSREHAAVCRPLLARLLNSFCLLWLDEVIQKRMLSCIENSLELSVRVDSVSRVLIKSSILLNERLASHIDCAALHNLFCFFAEHLTEADGKHWLLLPIPVEIACPEQSWLDSLPEKSSAQSSQIQRHKVVASLAKLPLWPIIMLEAESESLFSQQRAMLKSTRIASASLQKGITTLLTLVVSQYNESQLVAALAEIRPLYSNEIGVAIECHSSAWRQSA